VTWNVIRLLRVLGLATKVQDRIPQPKVVATKS
jgi:hypothetical protein